MMRRRVFFLLLLFACVLAHPTEIPGESGSSAIEFGLTFTNDLPENDTLELGTQRREALETLQQIFGIPEPSGRPNPQKNPPQFMIELYNTIAEPNGITRGKNPYNAKIVRSFIERDGFGSQHYLFNISGMEMNESVLEAELHLFRKRTPRKAMHPAVLSSPYYLIRVYQVLYDDNLHIPDLHRLLNVHYVGAHASGWQVFNVKQAVLSWISGAPNLGLLVTASSLFGDDAAVHFLRRNDHRHSRYPILVLFNDDGKDGPPGENLIPHYYKYANDLHEEEEDEDEDAESFRNASFGVLERHKEDTVLPEESGQTATKVAARKEEEDEYRQSRGRERRETSSPEKVQRIVSKNGRMAGALSSMDIYERAAIRKKLARSRNADRAESPVPLSTSALVQRRSRSTPETSTPKSNATESNATECAKHELYVDFGEIGWSDIIVAPPGYSAYHCRGHCKFPLSQSQHPTNHATVQSIVHMLHQGRDVNQPCCVPTKLLGISILYLDNSNVVLKLYQDMVADRCGCH